MADACCARAFRITGDPELEPWTPARRRLVPRRQRHRHTTPGCRTWGMLRRPRRPTGSMRIAAPSLDARADHDAAARPNDRVVGPDDITRRTPSRPSTAACPRLCPDPTRVLGQLFVPGARGSPARARARRRRVVAHVLDLSDDEVSRALADIEVRFGQRHQDLTEMFERPRRAAVEPLCDVKLLSSSSFSAQRWRRSSGSSVCATERDPRRRRPDSNRDVRLPCSASVDRRRPPLVGELPQAVQARWTRNDRWARTLATAGHLARTLDHVLPRRRRHELGASTFRLGRASARRSRHRVGSTTLLGRRRAEQRSNIPRRRVRFIEHTSRSTPSFPASTVR